MEMDANMAASRISIRPMAETDWDAVWSIMAPVFRAGETYPFAWDIGEEEACRIWVTEPTAAFVAVNDHKKIAGTYYLKPNPKALEAQVCNCGYIVAADARRQGVARALCEHSLREAGRLGFKAMQFNSVAVSNEAAIRLWTRIGFEITGTRPKAFRHPRLGLVDTYVMYRSVDG